MALPTIWVLSTGRCGTLSLAKLLNESPDIDGHHEPRPKAPLSDRMIAWHTPYNAPSPIDTERGERIRVARSRGLIYAETAWDLTPYAYKLETDYQFAKFIFLHREPRAWIRSWMRDGVFTMPKHPAKVQDIIPDPEIAEAPEPVRCAWWWHHVNTFGWEFHVQSNRCFRISSEELWQPDLTMIRALFRFLGARPPSDVWVKGWSRRKWNERKRPLVDWNPEWEELLPRELMLTLGYT
jgi:hypothetical protein